ncbi:MAG TPA: hypothetical protein VNB22_25125 [Pyrinomonadaceae bacterium]|nr:hypothetical protein [Pyrinomonadaceae bacterium]
MAVKKKEKQAQAQNSQDESAPAVVEENAPAEDFPAELREAVWSVVSFDKCEASNLTYAEAEQKLTELEAQKVSGLCIVTDETAARIAGKN